MIRPANVASVRSYLAGMAAWAGYDDVLYYRCEADTSSVYIVPKKNRKVSNVPIV